MCLYIKSAIYVLLTNFANSIYAKSAGLTGAPISGKVSTKMQANFIAATLLISCAVASIELRTDIYNVIALDHELSYHGTIVDIAADSLVECAVQCRRVGCSSFSLSKLAVCKLSILGISSGHLQAEGGSITFEHSGKRTAAGMLIFFIPFDFSMLLES